MKARKKDPSKYKKRCRAIFILLSAIIMPLIISSPLFSFNNKNPSNINDFAKDEKKDLIEEQIQTSSNHPTQADDFLYYKEITVDNTLVSGTDNLLNFPILINITDADLHDYAQADGDDIAFALQFEWLDHEIEFFNQTYNATHAHLIAWVRVPVLYATIDTIIRMYYGNPDTSSRQNPAGVWDNDYVGVWHLKESPPGTVLDSTQNNYDGTPSGSMNSSNQVDGQIDGSLEFDGSTDLITIGQIDSNAWSAITLEAWIKMDDTDDDRVIAKEEGTGSGPHIWMLGKSGSSIKYRLTTDGTGGGYSQLQPGGSLGTTDWYHLAMTWDSISERFIGYLDGGEVANVARDGDSISDSIVNVILADQAAGVRQFDGMISEARISKSARSADWISTEFNNQDDPSSFYTISSRKAISIPSFSDYDYYKEITIDSAYVYGSGSHTDFPLYIFILDADLHNYTQLDGDDIAFSNGTTWLDHEIETFIQDVNGTHAALIAWVRIPKLSTSENTVIRLHFGNPTIESQENPEGVWDSNYKGVWHLADPDPGAAIKAIEDATLNNNNGTDYTNVAFQSVFMLGYGVSFDDSADQRIEIEDDPTLHISDKLTVEAWVRPTVVDEWSTIISKMGGAWGSGSSAEEDLYYAVDSSGQVFVGLANPSGSFYEWTSGVTLTAGNWQHLVFTYDSATSIGTLYRNGVYGDSVNFGLGTLETNTNPLYLGFNRGWTNEMWDGDMDEVRISNTVRTDFWIVTEYINNVAPSFFYSVGNLVKTSEDAPSDADKFGFYKIITIDHKKIAGSGSHTDFPVLISITDTDLHDDTQVDGDDIAFSLGDTWLDHEIELFSKNGTHAQLIAWVRIPQLSTSIDTDIRMYYANPLLPSQENPIGVWSSNYKGVWHLAETSGDVLDSTTFSEDGTVSGTLSRPVNGTINNAYDFGSDGMVYIGDPIDDHLDFGFSSFSVSFWTNIDASTGTWQIPLYKGASGTWDPGYCFVTTPTGDGINFYVTDGVANVGSPEASISFGSWTYITGVVDRNADLIRIYKDGVEISSGSNIGFIGDLSGNIELKFPFAPDNDLDGRLDEVRIIGTRITEGWINTEFNNQYDPNTFYSIGSERTLNKTYYSALTVNAIDLYGNLIPDANVSIYNNNTLIDSLFTNENGSAIFSNLTFGQYNFSVTLISTIGNYIAVVNITSNSTLVDQLLQTVNLTCNVSTNFFEITDVDGKPVDSGWIIVGNGTNNLQNCSLDNLGHARFWWINATPYLYNYSIYYKDVNYNPKTIKLTNNTIVTPNTTIQEKVNLTTVNFTILTTGGEPVSGAIIKLNNSIGISIVNLTTDINGRAQLRWLNSSGIGGNYSFSIEFFGDDKFINATSTEWNFTLSSEISYEFRISITLTDFETELISLNPKDNIAILWGTQLRISALFNVTKAVGYENLEGPAYADSMAYEILEGIDLIQSGAIPKDLSLTGRHSVIIDTKGLQSGSFYLIKITAQKSGFTLPTDLILQLSILENELILNQSINDDSSQSVYWSDNATMSVKPYGKISEIFTIGDSIFKNTDQSFNLSIPDIQNIWNLSQIVFNIYNISWTVAESDINITILDPNGSFEMFHFSNHSGYDFNKKEWTGISIQLDQRSLTGDNKFEFTIGGSFNGTIDIITETVFVRDYISMQYSKFNVTNEITILTEVEGWAMRNITFEIFNCRYISNWSSVDLSDPTILNISTIDNFNYSIISGGIGYGKIIIDDRNIVPSDKKFLFTIRNSSNIIFDVLIKAEYIQDFYTNQYLESYNLSGVANNFNTTIPFQVSAIESGWIDDYATLEVTGINNGTNYFLPSQLAMNITLGAQVYSITDIFQGKGAFSLKGINKSVIYSSIISTLQPVNFTLSFILINSRLVFYETTGNVSYIIRESPDIFGTVDYNATLGYYLQIINTSAINANEYTIRFTIDKPHYSSSIKDLDLKVLNRLTLINGSTGVFKVYDSIYVKDAVNYTFIFTDELQGTLISNLDDYSYDWDQFNSEGSLIASGSGNLIPSQGNNYILDFNTENLTVGDYSILIVMDKENYNYKIAIVSLTIEKREITVGLSNNIVNSKINVIKGDPAVIEITLIDPTNGSIPLTGVNIVLTIEGKSYTFKELGEGIYILEYSTIYVDAFITPRTLTGTITISKINYLSEEIPITIVVGMEEIFPGIPTFYFLLILLSAIGVTVSLVAYRLVKQAQIPQFVKRARTMKKAIQKSSSISDSLLYVNKEEFIASMLKNKWDAMGLSIEDSFRLKVKKGETLPTMKKKVKAVERSGDQMPVGLVLMRWDERMGAEVLVRYPEEVIVTDKTLMQIYSTHEYSGETGIINLMVGSLNIASYYTGPEKSLYLILILNLEDDGDAYEGALSDTVRIILQNMEEDAYLPLIPSLFQRLSVYPSLSEEGHLMHLYQDDVKRMILNRLREEGIVSKSELMVWLKDKYLEGFVDIEGILIDFIRRDITKELSVKGMPSEQIFLISDFYMVRVPPIDLLKNPQDRGLPSNLTEVYKGEVLKLFNTYTPSEEDNLTILNVLTNPQVYETLKLLRTAIVTLKDLEKLRKKGVDDTNTVLRLLWDAKMINVFKDQSDNEYYALISDFHVEQVFPKYLMNIVKASYDQKSKLEKVLIQYLKVLEETYFDLNLKEKKTNN
jgi:hypothetical protein